MDPEQRAAEAGENRGLTAEERQRAIELIAEAELRQEQRAKVVCDNGAARLVNEQPVKKDISFTPAADLMNKDFPPIEFLADGMLTAGLAGLSAKSKLGKSWLALQLAVSVALGDKFLGTNTKKAGVLYIDLENTPPLTQERLRRVLNGRDIPENLYFAHEFNMIGNGFEEDLCRFLDANGGVKLVIIDVLQKVKPSKKNVQTDYESDYQIFSILKGIADKYGICIFPIYHDRKLVDTTDAFSNVLGSTAIMGSADLLWSLSKKERKDQEATLSISGRTLPDASYKLRFTQAGLWENLGNAELVEEARKRQEYENDPVVNTIRNLVKQNHGKWRGLVSEIIQSSQYFSGCRIYGTAQKVGKDIAALEGDLAKYDEILHRGVKHGNAGMIHIFESQNPFINNSS